MTKIYRNQIDDEGMGQAVADIKYLFLKSKEIVINKVLNVGSIIVDFVKANLIETNKIKTQIICVGETCIDENDLKNLIQNNANKVQEVVN